jgi:nucleotide-binding universal stress UspA family protein
MPMFKRILCPTDFSEASYLALEKAVELAKDGVSEVCILHVEPDMHEMLISGTMPTHVAADQRAEAIRKLCAVVEERTPNFVQTNAVLRQGEVASEIMVVTREQGADLIVMSSHGAGSFQSSGLGSIVSRVLRKAPCPVLVINSDSAALADSVVHKMSNITSTM